LVLMVVGRKEEEGNCWRSRQIRGKKRDLLLLALVLCSPLPAKCALARARWAPSWPLPIQQAQAQARLPPAQAATGAHAQRGRRCVHVHNSRESSTLSSALVISNGVAKGRILFFILFSSIFHPFFIFF
jgi:hypothetical protein